MKTAQSARKEAIQKRARRSDRAFKAVLRESGILIRSALRYEKIWRAGIAFGARSRAAKNGNGKTH